MSDVVEETGLSQATINRKHRAGEFPRKRRLSAAAVGWWQSDIDAWKADRPLADHSGPAVPTGNLSKRTN